MTSKEFIQTEIDKLEDILENARRDNCKPVIIEIEEELEQYRQLLKDLEKLEYYEIIFKEPLKIIRERLEVLEALKRNVGIRFSIQEWANRETRIFPNDRKIVKKWLENENNNK